MAELALIIHNVRSAHNVGSLLRTAEGLGVNEVYMTGITPYPAGGGDKRLPHISQKVHRRIAKTSLGAEESVAWEHKEDISGLINHLKRKGFLIAALEQAPDAVPLQSFRTSRNLALIVGNEVEGLDDAVQELADVKIHIPMAGLKESFNVAAAGAMALYHLRFKV
jgi:tRNA G18 (ribose-2'-O)-methylase SpoU